MKFTEAAIIELLGGEKGAEEARGRFPYSILLIDGMTGDDKGVVHIHPSPKRFYDTYIT